MAPTKEQLDDFLTDYIEWAIEMGGFEGYNLQDRAHALRDDPAPTTATVQAFLTDFIEWSAMMGWEGYGRKLMFRAKQLRGDELYEDEQEEIDEWELNPAADVMYHPGPSLDRDIVFAVVRHGPSTAPDIWNIVRDRFPAATPAAVSEICSYLVEQGAFDRLAGDVFTSRRRH
jgi:hypothetical protein